MASTMSVRRFLGRMPNWPLLAPALFALSTLAVLVPVVDLDPARGVTFSNSPFSDEVWNVVNARNLVLLGTWSTDQWNLHLINGPVSLVEAAVFSALGVGIVQARLVAIVCTALTGATIVLGLQRWIGRLAAVIAGVAYVTSALALYYGRLAYVEPMTAWLLVSGLLTLAAVEHRPTAWGIAAGVAFGLAIASKALAIPCVAAILFATGWLAIRDPQLRRWLMGTTLALVLVAISWGVVVLLPHREEIAILFAHVLPQIRFDFGPTAVRRVVGFLLGAGDDRAVFLSLPLLVGALAGTAVVARGRHAIPRRPLVLYSVAAFAFAASVVVVAAASYHPNRYIVPFLPVGALLVGPAVQWIRSRLTAGPRGAGLGIAAAGACLVALATPGILQHLSWTGLASRSLPALQAAGVDAFPRGQVVAGPYAALVAFRAPVVAVVTCCGTDPANGGDLYETRQARYVVAGPTAPDWLSRHPSAWAGRVRLLCFTWGSEPEQYCVYRLP
jgi:4-amino-4-deoxy-L-arabinose transferase-like glycosyltransferase